MSSYRVTDVYERHAADYDSDRDRSLNESKWLNRFLAGVPRRGTVLDLGCGMGEPVARYIQDRGFPVVGVDSSPAMIEACRNRFPASEWLVGDMRALELERRFEGVLAWNSFFHLTMDDQRAMFPRFAEHCVPGAPLMFTSGAAAGESVGSYRGEPLYHASLDPAEYRSLLADHGFAVLGYVAHDVDCGDHTVWLARFTGGGSTHGT